jgi:diaminopimelate epimerase
MAAIPFTKMHGLGNDFVVIDARKAPLTLAAEQVRALADRHTGIGCDQVIIIEQAPGDARDAGADAFMRILNADGSEVDACGNAMRCVAFLLMRQDARDSVLIATGADLLSAKLHDDGLVTVDMGKPRLDWRDIPLSEPLDSLHLKISEGPLHDPVGVSMGNPHCVFFVDDADAVDLATIGPILEHHTLFPERANIEVAEIRDGNSIRLRVWERGAGNTRACGTGACATLVAAHRRGLAGRTAHIELDGGTLAIEWRDDDHVLMTGPAATSFSGSFDGELIG